MIRAFTLSLGQLFDAAVLQVFVKVMLVTLAIFGVVGFGLWQLGLWAIGTWGWADYGAFAAIGATLLAVVLGWLLFRVVAIAVMGVFADDVVAAVEREHYPQALAASRSPSLALALRMGLASVSRALLFNLLALPLYGVLLITGVGTVLLFALVNAMLLGRDLGEMVAIRHMPRSELKGWLETTRTQRLLLGGFVTALFIVPVVNLVAPIIGAAMMTHLFHKDRK